METPIPLDGGLPVTSSPSPRLVPRLVSEQASRNPRFETRSGAISSRGKVPGVHPPGRWPLSVATPALGDLFAMEVLSSVPRECCVLPVRIEEIDGDQVTVSDPRDKRRWYVGRLNRDSKLSRAQIVTGDLSAKK